MPPAPIPIEYTISEDPPRTHVTFEEEPPLPTLCLNMIVKNESKIILRLLESTADLIDSYCICDTGSTDNTVELIETFYRERGIPGKVVHEPFRDFGYNRTFAMHSAAEMDDPADYLLLLDADMIFVRTLPVADLKRRLTTHNAFYLFQGSTRFNYKNTRVVKNNGTFSYWGVTHEYVNVPKSTTYGVFPPDEVFINDIGDGGSKGDKAQRDIRLLTQGLVDEPDSVRYTFYLANSYRDIGDTTQAMVHYRKRIALGGWVEEVWQSHYNLGKIYKSLGDNAQAIFCWLEAYNAFPNRIENLHEIIQHYRLEGKNRLAYTLYMMADRERRAHPSADYLFMHRDIYDYKLDYELSILGYYCNPDRHDLAGVSMKVLMHPAGVEESIARNVLSNYKFYAPKLTDIAQPLSPANLALLASIGDANRSYALKGFVSSTPCLVQGKDPWEWWVNVRYVNYRIDDQGGYVNLDQIVTKNVLARFQTKGETWTRVGGDMILEHDPVHDGRYVGLEDVRLMYDPVQDKILYNANRGLGVHHMKVEHGVIDPDLAFAEGHLLDYADARPLEKNWVLFESTDPRETQCVYGWHPLVIGTIRDGKTFQKTHEHPTPPAFKHVRGSTNGIRIDDEVWFLCHAVSYEDRRYYYHLVVVLDAATGALKKYSKLWTFEGAKVEYTLGWVYQPHARRFCIGYSVMDRETKYMMISKHALDALMVSSPMVL